MSAARLIACPPLRAGTRATIPATVASIYWEHRELLDHPRLRQLIEAESSPGAPGECTPLMDVVETSAGIEVLVDLPGVPRSQITIVFSQGTLDEHSCRSSSWAP